MACCGCGWNLLLIPTYKASYLNLSPKPFGLVKILGWSPEWNTLYFFNNCRFHLYTTIGRTKRSTRRTIKKHRLEPSVIICHIAVPRTSISTNLVVSTSTCSFGISTAYVLCGSPYDLRQVSYNIVSYRVLLMTTAREVRVWKNRYNSSTREVIYLYELTISWIIEISFIFDPPGKDIFGRSLSITRIIRKVLAI